MASDIPGPADLLAAGAGLLVPLDDHGQLARELDRLASDPLERQRLGSQARKLVDERYAFRRVAERYRALYDELLGETHRESAAAEGAP